MNWLQRTLTTLGLAVALGGCGAANTDAVRYERGGLAYIVQHETGMSVPDMDRVDADRRAVDFAEEGRLPPGFALTGYLHADGTDYEVEDEGSRYDAVVWTADTNGDGDIDLMRLLVNTQITTAPTVRSVGRSIHVQVLVQDTDHDGNADRRWVDNHGADDSREPDGTYDELLLLEDVRMAYLIDRLVWYPRQNRTTTSDRTLDFSEYGLNREDR